MATVGLYIFSFQQFAVPYHEIAGAIGWVLVGVGLSLKFQSIFLSSQIPLTDIFHDNGGLIFLLLSKLSP